MFGHRLVLLLSCIALGGIGTIPPNHKRRKKNRTTAAFYNLTDKLGNTTHPDDRSIISTARPLAGARNTTTAVDNTTAVLRPEKSDEVFSSLNATERTCYSAYRRGRGRRTTAESKKNSRHAKHGATSAQGITGNETRFSTQRKHILLRC